MVSLFCRCQLKRVGNELEVLNVRSAGKFGRAVPFAGEGETLIANAAPRKGAATFPESLISGSGPMSAPRRVPTSADSAGLAKQEYHLPRQGPDASPTSFVMTSLSRTEAQRQGRPSMRNDLRQLRSVARALFWEA